MVAVTVVAAAVVIAAVTKVAKAVAVDKAAAGRAARVSADPNAQRVANAGRIDFRSGFFVSADQPIRGNNLTYLICDHIFGP